MSFLKSPSAMSSILVIILCLGLSNAAIFYIRNDCSYTVWAAAVPGGGRKLKQGETWTLNVNTRQQARRIWARTNCSFDETGRGKCETGDCGGLLQCQGYGQPPNTLAEYALNQFGNMDFFDISLVDGFNPCTVFRNNQFCCYSGICEPTTTYSMFFEDLCPDAYSYPLDTTRLFSCPNATHYNVIFCP